MITRILRTLIVASVLALALVGGAAHADDASRAGLVVVYAPDDVQTACVTFDAAEISGIELLERSRLAIVQAGSAERTVCKIEDVGCDYPGEHCFCESFSAPWTYWNYWYWQDGDWVYSPRGATTRRVSDGALEAWVWSNGQARPPAVDLDSICTAPSDGAPPQLSSSAQQDYPSSGEGDSATPYPTVDMGYPEPETGEEPTETPEEIPTEEPTATAPAEEETPEETPAPSATPEGGTPTVGTPAASPSATATRTATPRATSTPAAAATRGATRGTPAPAAGASATPTDDGMAAAISTAVAANRSTLPPSSGRSGIGSYLAFGLLALVLVALIVYAVLLRRQHARGQAE